ncbi:MAG: flagellar protein FlaG [Syntrophaceae bacterium]
MNSIDNRIAIGRMAASIGTRAKSGPHCENLPARDIPARSGPDNPVQTDISFSTYGSHNEHIAAVIKNQDTGEVIREIPSEEMQKLHAHLDMLI